MRTLSFIVDKQKIKRDPGCDFRDLVSGTKNYICFHFSFSEDWNKTKKAIQFLSESGEEIDAVLLDETDSCLISDKISSLTKITFRLYGIKEDFKILTSLYEVYQRKGG